jgi:inosose dehydratase
VHLKDVREDLAERVRTGATTYTQAVKDGIYVPLGAGDVDLAALVELLRDNDYDGWYVLEQDTALADGTADGTVDGTVDGSAADTLPRTHTRQSLDHLARLMGWEQERGNGRRD